MQVAMSRRSSVVRHLALLAVALVLAFSASAVTGWPWPSMLILVGSGVLAAGFAQSLGQDGEGQGGGALGSIVQWSIGTVSLALMLASLLWWLS